MAIKRIKVKNFKSFKELDVELGNLNILIGKNASGKSNFADIFRSLKDIRDSGLENAISLQGGVGYLRNINTDPSEILSLEIFSDISDQEFVPVLEMKKKLIKPIAHEMAYRFAIQLEKKGSGYQIVYDRSSRRFVF